MKRKSHHGSLLQVKRDVNDAFHHGYKIGFLSPFSLLLLDKVSNQVLAYRQTFKKREMKKDQMIYMNEFIMVHAILTMMVENPFYQPCFQSFMGEEEQRKRKNEVVDEIKWLFQQDFVYINKGFAERILNKNSLEEVIEDYRDMMFMDLDIPYTSENRNEFERACYFIILSISGTVADHAKPFIEKKESIRPLFRKIKDNRKEG